MFDAPRRPPVRAALWMALGAALLLPACVPVALVGGTVGAGALLVSSDRRSSATQDADNKIEQAARDALQAQLVGRGHVSVNSYYRKVLITGEVPTEQDRRLVHQIVAAVPGQEGIVNDLAVMPESSVSSRTSDSLLATRVRSALLQANGVPSGSIKTVTERGTVYLMGRLTSFEAQLATDVVRQMDGVQRVVRVIDLIAPTGSGTGALGQAGPAGASASPAVATQVSGAAEGSSALGAPAGVQVQPVAAPALGAASAPALEVRNLPPAQ